MQDFIMIKPENGCFYIYIIYNEKNRSGIDINQRKKKFTKYFKYLQFIFILKLLY